jgi:hypothetical protein
LATNAIRVPSPLIPGANKSWTAAVAAIIAKGHDTKLGDVDADKTFMAPMGIAVRETVWVRLPALSGVPVDPTPRPLLSPDCGVNVAASNTAEIEISATASRICKAEARTELFCFLFMVFMQPKRTMGCVAQFLWFRLLTRRCAANRAKNVFDASRFSSARILTDYKSAFASGAMQPVVITFTQR